MYTLSILVVGVLIIVEFTAPLLAMPQ